MAKKPYTLRKLINDIHLWLGLGSGLLIFLVCFSGTVLTFEHEIKGLFSEQREVQVAGAPQSLEKLVAKVEGEGHGMVTAISISDTPNAFYDFSVKKDPSQRRGSKLLVDPNTGSTHAEKETSADGFFSAMFRLHRWLLLDNSIGRPIVGVATIIFLLLAISGLVLWFPKRLRWKLLLQGLKVKTSANWKRINHDLHNSLGFYACIFILIMGLTGLCWSFESYREQLGKLIGAEIFNRSAPDFATNPSANGQWVSLDEAVEIANRELAYQGKVSISLPETGDGVYEIRKYNSSSLSPVTYDRLYLSASGEVLAIELFTDKPLAEKVAGLIKPIHTGEIFGTFSKIIYFLACLIATSLPVTGTLIWWNKLKKKQRKATFPILEEAAA